MRTGREFERLITLADAVVAIAPRLTMVWLMTIVVLPFTTQLIQTEAHQDGAVPVYIGVSLVSSLSLLALSAHGRRHPELLATGPEIDRWVNEPVTAVTPGLLAVALVLSIVFAQVGTWPLLLLVLDDAIEGLWLRFRRRSV